MAIEGSCWAGEDTFYSGLIGIEKDALDRQKDVGVFSEKGP